MRAALATGTYAVDQTTHALSLKSANAHERDDGNVVAVFDESMAVAAPAMVIDKFPTGLTQKNLGAKWECSALRVSLAL
jgi:hypothetical protein